MSATATQPATADLNVLTLKADDRVGVTPGTSWGHYRTEKVERVTPGGQVVLMDGTRFNRDGREIGGSGRNPRRLVSAAWADAVEAREQAQRERDARATALKEKLAETLRGATNGYGKLVGEVTDAQKAELIALIQAL